MHKSFTVMLISGVLTAVLLAAGCTSASAPASWSVDNNGTLSVKCGSITTTEQVLFTNDTYTKTKIILHTQNGDVTTYLGAPKQPKAVLVYAPGAGEKISGHEERMVRFAAAGFAFLFVDTRGNGGETPGNPFNPQAEFDAFENGEWPQYYMTVCDLSLAQQEMSQKFGVPVYAMGSSNGGRYAAVAAGTDTQFAGYIGISTADWGLLNSVVQQGITGEPVRFTKSLEPSTYLSHLSPRPIWMFHSRSDPIIPFELGQDLYNNATQPKTFTEFYGGHGIDPSVDALIIGQWAQIYGNRG